MNTAAVMDSVETGVCVKCGRSHELANRQRLIRPMVDEEASFVAVAWPCFYGDYRVNTATERMLFRDLAAVRGDRRRSA